MALLFGQEGNVKGGSRIETLCKVKSYIYLGNKLCKLAHNVVMLASARTFSAEHAYCWPMSGKFHQGSTWK